MCATRFTLASKRRYCRVAAHSRRHQTTDPPEVLLPAGQPRRSHTVYECPIATGGPSANNAATTAAPFMRSLGLGGLWPYSEKPITVDELLNR